MDYEKKYNEALERARALWPEAIEKEYVDDYLKDYETIFPELREGRESYENVAEEMRKQIVPNDLEEAAGGWYEKCPLPKSIWWNEGEEMKLTDSRETFIAGAKWQKEQMMKEGDEGIVRKVGTIGYITFTDEQQFNSRLEQFQDRDKVRIIIVKED